VDLLLAMLGAGVGATSRWLLDQAVQARHDSVLPWGTFVVNVSGSFALGVLLAAASLGTVEAAAVALAGAGFCGGFTTFSTFGYETLRLVEEGARVPAIVNALGSVGVGLAAAVAGWWCGGALWG
jgi:CrcB protein